MQILHNLGSWPVGVWYCTSEEACRPRGQVLIIEWTSRGSFTASLLSAGAVPNPPIVQEDAWGVRCAWRGIGRGSGVGAPAAIVALFCCWDAVLVLEPVGVPYS